jgi:uracil-DNA glycosylase family 4
MTADRGRDPREELRSLVQDGAGLVRFIREHRLARPTPPGPAPPLPAPDGADSLERVAAEIASCAACGLAAGRRNTVPGEGAARAELMIIGEGPGLHEDRTGRPFVGKAGEMLTKMLERVLEIPRADAFIANIVKCRPPENRDPEDDEAAACRPYLERQISLVGPRVIICLGRIATHHLLGTTESISRMRGRIVVRGGIEVVPTFHPAYLLRTPADKALVMQDLLLVKARLEALRRAAPAGEDR